MHSLESSFKRNVERTIQLILDRAEAAGTVLTRNEVLEHLKFTDDEDVSQWEATVDAMMADHKMTHTMFSDERVAA
jgi:hypothetical protein